MTSEVRAAAVEAAAAERAFAAIEEVARLTVILAVVRMSEMAAVAGAVARAAAESAFAAMEEVATVIPGSFHFFSAQPRSARRTGLP